MFYINTEREYGENISRKISEKIKYKESYVKNLTKECFTKGYLKSSKKGLAGGNIDYKVVKNSYFSVIFTLFITTSSTGLSLSPV